MADLAGIFRRRDRKAINRSFDLFERNFPQCRVHVATCHVRTPYSVSLFAIWAFNRANLYAGRNRGGANRDILLAIDPNMRSAAMTLGYGLEPLVGKHHLENAIVAGQMELDSGRFGEAILSIFEALAEEMVSVVQSLDRTFGLPDEQSVEIL